MENFALKALTFMIIVWGVTAKLVSLFLHLNQAGTVILAFSR